MILLIFLLFLIYDHLKCIIFYLLMYYYYYYLYRIDILNKFREKIILLYLWLQNNQDLMHYNNHINYSGYP